MGGRGKKSLIFGVLLFSVFLLALVGAQNALAVSIAVVEGSLLELSGNYPIQLFFGAIKGETTMLYTDGEFDIPVDTAQASVTISTDKSTYKENEGINVPYAISKRIPDEKLTITLYDPNDSDVSKTIIDDNTDTTTMLSEFFNFEGFETVVISDPWEGLKRIQQEKFDVILLDIIMPELNGLQIIATLATDEILQDQNIFIYSANFGHDNQIKDLLRRDGINGCLKKPMDLNEMLKTITKKVNLQKTTPSEII